MGGDGGRPIARMDQRGTQESVRGILEDRKPGFRTSSRRRSVAGGRWTRQARSWSSWREAQKRLQTKSGTYRTDLRARSYLISAKHETVAPTGFLTD